MGFTDRNGAAVEIRIAEEGWEGEAVELTPGASPLTLQEDDTEGLDTPSRAWTGRLTVVAEAGVDLSGLYAPEVTSSRVTVRRGGQLAWVGYLSPEVVRQSWVGGDEVTVNVQSPLAALDGLTLDPAGGFGYVTLGGMLAEVAGMTGDWSHVVFPDDISVPGSSDTAGWMEVRVSRAALFSRNVSQEFSSAAQALVSVVEFAGSTGRATVEAVARLLGWTARERADHLIFSAESVNAYRSVAVAELTDAGRAVTDAPANVVELGAFVPAGTGHTLSQLLPVRRVAVEVDDETPDDLFADAVDASNWRPAEAYDFQEDGAMFTGRGEFLIPAGMFVSSLGGDISPIYPQSDYRDIVATTDPTSSGKCVRVDFSRYESPLSVDGESRVYTYRATHEAWTTWDVEAPAYAVTLEEAQPNYLYRMWGVTMNSTEPERAVVMSDVGAYRARVHSICAAFARYYRHDPGAGSPDYDFYLLSDIEQPVQLDGFALWGSLYRHAPLFPGGDPGCTPPPLVRLHDPRELCISSGALLAKMKFSGFRTGMEADQFTGEFRIGPASINPVESERSHPAVAGGRWPLRLRVGGKVWREDDETAGHWEEDDGTDAPTWWAKLATTSSSDLSCDLEPSDDISLNNSYGVSDGQLLPLTDATGAAVELRGDVELVIYFPPLAVYARNITYPPVSPTKVTAFNPIIVHGISVNIAEPLYLNGFDAEPQTRFERETGARSVEEEHAVTLTLSAGDVAKGYHTLTDATGRALTGLQSKRLGQPDARPTSYLALELLRRLYGRSRQRLTVEVDAAGLDPGATVRDGATYYALTGVEWDVRDARCKYTFEDFIPFDQWAGR